MYDVLPDCNTIPPVAESYQLTPDPADAVTDKAGMASLLQIVWLPLLVAGFWDAKTSIVNTFDKVEQNALPKLA